MRWARVADGEAVSFGIVEGDGIQLVDGTPFGAWRAAGRARPLGELRLLPPVMPHNFYALGWNYAGHRVEAAARAGRSAEIPPNPHFGYRTTAALTGHGSPVVLPPDCSGKLQFEGELVAVIGRTAKHLSEADALSCVLGFTIGNDATERSWQASDRTLWRAKNADTFKPMGPWIETEVDLGRLVTRVSLNGRQVSEFKTDAMIFGVARCLAYLTKWVTVHPGDVLWMGTDEPTLDMVEGDEVAIEIEGIGTLRNPVVAG